MAKKGKKGKKGKGKKRASGKKGRVSHRLSKPGLAESLGLLKTAYDVESDTTSGYTVGRLQIDALKHPTNPAFINNAVNATVAAVKAKGGPAILGIVVSNADAIPVFGKMLRPFKHKADRIVKRYTGMKL